MGAIKFNSRWGLLIGAALLSLASSGCMITDSYSLRPGNWFVHNLFPSSCKMCPGGMPGPNGCRSFKDPWCAGYQATMWRDLGADCGPSRLPSALALADQQQPRPAAQPTAEAPSGDQAPALPENFPSPLPTNPGQIPTPLPELPLDGTGTAPEENPFPLNKVPSTPDLTPENPLAPPNEGPPTVPPDLFPESRPGTGKKPAAKTPLVVPDKIDDLFTPPKNEPPSSKVPSALPPSKTPATPLPNLEEKKSSETLPEPESKPAPKTSKPSVPFEGTPSVEDIPDLFPDSKKKPAEPNEKEKGKEPSVPKLFEDSSYNHPRPISQSQASVKFGQILPVSGAVPVTLRVQAADDAKNVDEQLHMSDLYNPAPVPVETSLRFLPR